MVVLRVNNLAAALQNHLPPEMPVPFLGIFVQFSRR
jgi:hypothetical protein